MMSAFLKVIGTGRVGLRLYMNLVTSFFSGLHDTPFSLVVFLTCLYHYI